MSAEPMVIAAEWILTYAIHGGVVLGVTFAVTRILRPAELIEEALWRFALLAGLLTATLQTAVGGAPIAAVALREAPVAVPAVAALDLSAVDLGTSAAVPPRPTGVESVASALELSDLVVLAALSLALFGLARLGLNRLALRRLLADRRPLLAGSPAVDALDRLRVRAGHAGRIRLSVTAALDAPVAFGVLRPEICVPRRALVGMEPAARDAMLAHELAHIVHRDPLWLELGCSVRALFPWMPFLGTACTRLRALAEFRSDAVGARLVGAVEVADCLVEVAGWIADGNRPAVAEGLVGMTVRREGLGARVDRLLATDGAPRDRLSPIALSCGAVAATVLLTAALPGAGVRPAPATPAPAVVPVVDPAPPAGDAADAPLRDLVDLVEAEQSALAEEVELLRAEAARLLPDPEIQELLDALDAQIRALDEHRAAIVAAIERYEDADASADPLPSDRR